tara:strand:+ start:1664 stop:1813 length:150 start_codon:yes stop_codon:yes gene_type:complete
MGEKIGDRKVMDTNVRDMVESGVKPERARKEARESMQRVDRKLRDQGKR